MCGMVDVQLYISLSVVTFQRDKCTATKIAPLCTSYKSKLLSKHTMAEGCNFGVNELNKFTHKVLYKTLGGKKVPRAARETRKYI